VAPHPLSVAVARALDTLVDEGAVPWQGALPDADDVEDVRVTRDGAGYATSLPLCLSGRAGLPADRLAGLLARRLSRLPGVASASAAGPGYVEVEPDLTAVVASALTPAGPGREEAAHGALDPLVGSPLDARLRDAVAEVGADAVRFALARRTTGPGRGDRPEAAVLDLAVLGRADERNPVHAVQLAHARLTGLLRQAAALGVTPAAPDAVAPEALASHPARELAASVAEGHAAAARAVRLSRPDLLAHRLSATADAAHRYLSWGEVLPSGADAPDDGHRARLRLAAAARDSLARGLDLLGVTAPERM
jgi:arginyl-tRNA synthetase